MQDLTIRDSSQTAILKQLGVTEQLLAQAASVASGTEQTAEIWAMPDLGLPNNIRRIHGGFFTGAVYTWQTTVPIVPIDATVNYCNVSVFRTSSDIISAKQFTDLVNSAIKRTAEKSSYIWNFAEGNHFITYGEVKGGTAIPNGKYVVLHSSAAEFKNQDNGLYPSADNWYAEKMKIIWDDSGKRYLRYVEGKTAERFIRTAHFIEDYNRLRHQYFADIIFGGENIEYEFINEPHYGMPTDNSISIGCQWLPKQRIFLLLTAPRKPLFFVDVDTGGRNQISIDHKALILQPHGLGKEAIGSLEIDYQLNFLSINNKKYPIDGSLKNEATFRIRSITSNNHDDSTPSIVEKFLTRCPGRIVGKLEPIYSYPYP